MGDRHMQEFTYCDKMGHRGRNPWLHLADSSGTIHRFRGKSIPGVVSVQDTEYEKNGKWSNTTYSLVLAAGVRPVAGIQGWEAGTFLEGAGIENWNDAANYYGVSVAEARRFLAANYPKSTAELNRRE